MPRRKLQSVLVPFIITTPTSQSLEDDRKLIRSHVMRGKNCKKPKKEPPRLISGGTKENDVSSSMDQSLSVSVKVGGEFSFIPVTSEITPKMLETLWSRKKPLIA
jgi:hypothetical protein